MYDEYHGGMTLSESEQIIWVVVIYKRFILKLFYFSVNILKIGEFGLVNQEKPCSFAQN